VSSLFAVTVVEGDDWRERSPGRTCGTTVRTPGTRTPCSREHAWSGSPGGARPERARCDFRRSGRSAWARWW
jgi:hypothetical protein